MSLAVTLLALNLATLLTSDPPSEAVTCVTFLPHSKTFVYATEGEVWVAGSMARSLYSQPGRIVALAVSPEGSLLASCSHEPEDVFISEVCVWDVVQGREVVRFKHRASSLAFAPDGQKLVTAGTTGVRLWDVKTGAQVSVLPEDGSSNLLVALGPGRAFAVARPTSIGLYNACSSQFVYHHEGLQGITSLASSPDGRRIAATDRDGGLKVWEVATGNDLLTVKAEKSRCVAFGLGGQIVAFGEGRTVVVWDLVVGECIARFRSGKTDVGGLAISSDGRHLVAVGNDGVHLWDLEVKRPAKNESVNLGDLESRNAKVAARAVFALAAEPKQYLPSLRNALRPARVVQKEEITGLVADLDSNQFSVRQRATTELEKLERVAAPALQILLATKTPLEVRRRAEQLLTQLEEPHLSFQVLRGLRTVEVLERINTPESRKLLRELAAGHPEARLTREAKAAVERHGVSAIHPPRPDAASPPPR